MALSDEAVKSLTERVRGEVILPSAADYDVHRRVFNARESRRPAVIVRCAGAADVMAAVSFAREHGLPVSARSGGHGPTGFAVRDDGVLIDLSLMRGVVVNPGARTAVVQAGALWRDVYREAEAFGLAPAGGSCDMVGVGGFTLGGGWGHLSRLFGLAIDNLNWVQVVTADGRLVTASGSENPDLFWALRGGGGGNFGVATAFEYRLHPLPSRIFGGTISFPYRMARKILTVYRDQVLAGLPDRLYLDVALYGISEKEREVGVTVVYVGPEAAGRKAVAPLVRLARRKDIDLGLRTYGSMLTEYAQEIVDGRLQLWKAGFLEPRVSRSAIDTIVEQFGAGPSPRSLFFIEPLGGAIQCVDAAATAFPHRDQLLCATIIGIWEDTAQTAVTERWTRGFRRALAPALSTAAYVNYPDLERADWRRAYYGDNYPRLVQVKKRYDPDDVFRFEQSIGRRP
jgi:hypothetical protein